jgi:hypothetical protein
MGRVKGFQSFRVSGFQGWVVFDWVENAEGENESGIKKEKRTGSFLTRSLVVDYWLRTILIVRISTASEEISLKVAV